MIVTHYEFNKEDEVLLAQQLEISSVEKTNIVSEALTIDTAVLGNDSTIITVFVNSIVDQQVIDLFPNLKLIITRSTGFDHIDIEYAATKGITVCNIPNYGSRTVAEFTFALILGLSRKVFWAIEQVKLKNEWNTSDFERFNLEGKTIGIIGTGRIGLNVAQIAKGMGMKIVATDSFPNNTKAVEIGFEYVPLKDLLAQSDVITLHVPANPGTHHLINTENVLQIKNGAILINTSRGDVADPEALLFGLDQGILQGVGLDVLEAEHDLKDEQRMFTSSKSSETIQTLLENHILMYHPRVIITPHIAFNATEARRDIIAITHMNIKQFLAGAPVNIIQLSTNE